MVAISDSDIVVGLDAELIKQIMTDASSGTETSSLYVRVSDTSSSSETWSIRVVVSDTITGTDTQSVNNTGTNRQDSDTLIGTDNNSISATLPVQGDSLTALESQSIAQILALRTDSVSATEYLGIVAVSDWSDYADGIIPEPPVLELDVLGPANIYLASFGAPEPDDTLVTESPDPAYWLALGGTLGGVSIKIKHQFDIPDVAQSVNPSTRRLKRRYVTASTSFAEPTLSLLNFALHGGTLDTLGTGYVSYQPSALTRAVPLDYNAIIIDGWFTTPTSLAQPKRRRIIMRKCLSTEGTSFSYEKDKQTAYDITWSTHYIDSTTPIMKIVDEV